MTTTTSAVKLLARRSQDRGHANHQWLQSYHTFSFANYHHYDFNGFSSLKVINEDRVQPSTGFPQHSHNNFEIFSYIVTGELEHKDSLGNLEIMKQGAIQMTSAGTGISHSEYNRNTTLPVHFLQVWISPAANGLKPQYYNRHFSAAEKRDKLVQILAPVDAPGVVDERDAPGPTPVHAPLSAFASILSSKKTISHTLQSSTTKAYVHLIMTSGYRSPAVSASDKFENGGAKVRLNSGLVLEEGDGAFVTVTGTGSKELIFDNVGEIDAEFLLFEME